jgi:hypothetical protein
MRRISTRTHLNFATLQLAIRFGCAWLGLGSAGRYCVYDTPGGAAAV